MNRPPLGLCAAIFFNTISPFSRGHPGDKATFGRDMAQGGHYMRDLRNVVARMLLRHQKRSRENEQFAVELFFDEEELADLKRARSGPRPGGSNHGRPSYGDST